MLFFFVGARLVLERTVNEVSGVDINTFKGVPGLPEILIIKGILSILNCLILFLILAVIFFSLHKAPACLVPFFYS